jgi:hypothetical protein
MGRGAAIAGPSIAACPRGLTNAVDRTPELAQNPRGTVAGNDRLFQLLQFIGCPAAFRDRSLCATAHAASFPMDSPQPRNPLHAGTAYPSVIPAKTPAPEPNTVRDRYSVRLLDFALNSNFHPPF